MGGRVRLMGGGAGRRSSRWARRRVPPTFPGLGAPDRLGDGVDAADELVLGEVAEGEEQCWLGRPLRESVPTQAGDVDPEGPGRLHDSVLVDIEREQEHGVAAGSQSFEAVWTEDGGHLLGQGVAAGAVEVAHPP